MEERVDAIEETAVAEADPEEGKRGARPALVAVWCRSSTANIAVVQADSSANVAEYFATRWIAEAGGLELLVQLVRGLNDLKAQAAVGWRPQGGTPE